MHQPFFTISEGHKHVTFLQSCDFHAKAEHAGLILKALYNNLLYGPCKSGICLKKSRIPKNSQGCEFWISRKTLIPDLACNIENISPDKFEQLFAQWVQSLTGIYSPRGTR